MSDISEWEVVAVREDESCYGALRVYGWRFEDAKPLAFQVAAYPRRADGTLQTWPSTMDAVYWSRTGLDIDWAATHGFTDRFTLSAHGGSGTGASVWTDIAMSEAYGPTSTVKPIVQSDDLGPLEGEFQLRGFHPDGSVDNVSPRLKLPDGVRNYLTIMGQCLVEVKADQEHRRAMEQAALDAEAAKIAAESEATRLQREKELELARQQTDAELAAIRLQDAAEQARLVKLAEAERTTTLRLRLEADLEIAKALQAVAEERIKGKLAREELINTFLEERMKLDATFKAQVEEYERQIAEYEKLNQRLFDLISAEATALEQRLEAYSASDAENTADLDAQLRRDERIAGIGASPSPTPQISNPPTPLVTVTPSSQSYPEGVRNNFMTFCTLLSGGTNTVGRTDTDCACVLRWFEKNVDLEDFVASELRLASGEITGDDPLFEWMVNASIDCV